MSSVEALDDNWIEWDDMNKTTYVGYLSFASIVGSAVSHPFYVLTTRQQVHLITGDTVIKANNLAASIKSITAKIGFRGLYRGWGPLTMINIPCNLAYLSCTELTRQNFRHYYYYIHPHASPTFVDFLQVIISSSMSNLCSLLISNPVEVVVSRMIVQHPHERTSIRSAINTIIAKNGYRGFRHGFGANFLYGTASSSTWWFGYSVSRRVFAKEGQNNGVLIDGISGFVAGVFCTTLVHPLDSIRARIMTGEAGSNTSVAGCLRHVLKHEGVKVLWRGIFTSLGETGVSSSVFALAYEFIKRSSSIAQELE